MNLKECLLNGRTEVVRRSVQSTQFTRIEKVLEFIHHHLFLPLSLDDIAKKSCWSRWQLQRVFTAKTGVNVAQYIRELKLSGAAESLLDSPTERVLDIALTFGFNSEISFSRSFKQFFGCSPREYRKRGIRTGLRQPITYIVPSGSHISSSPNVQALPLGVDQHDFTQIRIEHKPAFCLAGYRGEIGGLFSSQPDFQQLVPIIWHEFERLKSQDAIGHAAMDNRVSHSTKVNNTPVLRYGVIDTLSLHDDRLTYWASEECSDHLPANLKQLHIPDQQYVVLPHRGEIAQLKSKLEWLFSDWLPQSGYSGVDGFELEIYSANYQLNSPDAYMEYWLPIENHKS